MPINIVDIEGIGPHDVRLLNDVGILNTSQLLFAGSEREGRSELAKRCGIPEQKILKWVLIRDLYRISGLDRQYAELLRAAGIESARQLRDCHSIRLYDVLHAVNRERQLVRRPPNVKTIQEWICRARKLTREVDY